MPVVMVSSLTQAGAETTLEALEIGAVDFIAKPVNDVAAGLAKSPPNCRPRSNRLRVRASACGMRPAPVRAPRVARGPGNSDRIIAIGASTGGVEALKKVLADMPAVCPPIVITQHCRRASPLLSPSASTANARCMCQKRCMAKWSNPTTPTSHRAHTISNSPVPAVLAACSLNEKPPTSGHRPSVDVLFNSVARVAGKAAIGVILTGMGKDGTEGLLRHAPGRRHHARPGRGVLSDLRHATCGVRARRSDATTFVVAYGRRHSRCLRRKTTVSEIPCPRGLGIGHVHERHFTKRDRCCCPRRSIWRRPSDFSRRMKQRLSGDMPLRLGCLGGLAF